MKFAIGVLLFLWFLAGLIGVWMTDDLDARHWKAIALGPITLADAWNEHPVAVPGA